MWAVGKATGVKGHHACLDVIAAEKIASVIKEYFVVIVVVVIEGDLQCARVGFNGSRAESTYDKAIADKSRMR